MKKIISVVGARPNFIKLNSKLRQVILHTGQHFDKEMSGVFLKDLNLPKPKYNLGLKKGQIGKMIQGIQEILIKEKPKLVIVYGDVNSTAAGAIAAYQNKIPLMHVEAGVRSYNRNMLEEYNRIITDHIATINCCPTRTSVNNLKREGLNNMYFTGDVMLDRILPLKRKYKNQKKEEDDFILVTCHRAETVDNKKRLSKLISVLKKVRSEIVFPLHPRTKKRLTEFKINIPSNVKILKPQSYTNMMKLVAKSKVVITDSGGLQKEAYFFGKPCLIIRNETEWPDIIDGKSIILLKFTNLDTLPNLIKQKMPVPKLNSRTFGRGNAWAKIIQVMKARGFL